MRWQVSALARRSLRRPSGIGQSVIGYRPVAIGHRLYASGQRPIGHWPSVIGQRPHLRKSRLNGGNL
jgi:hypothetical protein